MSYERVADPIAVTEHVKQREDHQHHLDDRADGAADDDQRAGGERTPEAWSRSARNFCAAAASMST